MLQTRRSPAYPVIGLLAAQLIALLAVVFVTLPRVWKWHAFDLAIYYQDSLKLLHGQLPYRDFALEYPPLALLPFALPRLATFGLPINFSDYVWLFLIQNVIFSTLIALVVARISGWRPFALALYALLVAISAPLLPWRYDLFPALLTALALLCLLRERPAWAGIWLGLGVAAKLYPIVLLPIFGIYCLAGKNRPALLRLGLGCASAVALTLIPFVLLAPGPLLSFMRYHELRGLQLESLPAGAIVLAHILGRGAARLDFNYGALHLVSPLAGAALKWLPIVFLALYSVVLVCCLARFREEQATQAHVASQSLVVYCVAALLAFIVTNKVFSPQYIIWLLPFAPLLRPRQAGALLAICALTIILFPFKYDELLAMQVLPVLLLNLRNLLAVVLLLWLLIDRAPVSLRSALAWPVRDARQLLQR
ncbi:MAG TPA: glycosyltransferase 87 family protein [Roseiflexaceae bacterium]|nr:glycosyltransferase 87 family protein [Roseiflexaceae bacterium]